MSCPAKCSRYFRPAVSCVSSNFVTPHQLGAGLSSIGAGQNGVPVISKYYH